MFFGFSTVAQTKIAILNCNASFFDLLNRNNIQLDFQQYYIQPYPCGVCGLWVILQDSGQTKIRHFAYKVTVDQDITSCQVTVDVAHVRQVSVMD